MFVFNKARILYLLSKKKKINKATKPQTTHTHDSLNIAKKGRKEQERRAQKNKEGRKSAKKGEKQRDEWKRSKAEKSRDDLT